MQNVYPPDRVLVSTQLPLSFEVAGSNSYVDVFTEDERNAIIAKYNRPNLFNGGCIRLDSIQNNHAVISTVMFYDFLCCNIVGIHNRDTLAWPKLNQYLKKYGPITSFEKLLSIRELPNIIGTSTLLHDVNNDYLLVERNTSVSVGSGLFACTSSGSLCIDDAASQNPIVGCGVRELIEELNLNCTLSIEGIVAPIQKMQPIALLTGQVYRPWSELLPVMKLGADYKMENNNVYVVPKHKLLTVISMYAFTDAAAFHIFFEAGGNRSSWKAAESDFVNIRDYIK